MITVAEFMKTINYRITGGSEYQWNSYGSHSRYLDSDGETYSASIIFDSESTNSDGSGPIVYEATVCDYVNNRAYRLINPLFKQQMLEEAASRGIESTFAWDSVEYKDLECNEDWLEKATAIVAGVEYDERISIPLDLSNEELFVLMKMAHERDVTFNQFIEMILLEKLNNLKSKTPKIKSNKIKNKKKKNKPCEINCGNVACDTGCIAQHF
jgi:hypothetical protein